MEFTMSNLNYCRRLELKHTFVFYILPLIRVPAISEFWSPLGRIDTANPNENRADAPSRTFPHHSPTRPRDRNAIYTRPNNSSFHPTYHHPESSREFRAQSE